MGEHAANLPLSSLTGRTTTTSTHWNVERLALVRYDEGGFEGFLARIGTSEHDLLRGLKEESDPERVLSCYQEWLFFGVLHEFKDIGPDVFSIGNVVEKVRNGEEEREVISFRSLVNMLRRFCTEFVRGGLPEDTISGQNEGTDSFANIWPSILTGMENSNSRRVFREIQTHLASVSRQAFDAAYRFHGVIAAHWTRDPDSPLNYFPQLLVSLEILLETLRAVQSLLAGNIRAPFLRAEFPINVLYIRGRMLNHGWCPSRTSGVLSQSHGSGSVNYLLSLLPSFDSRDHGNCSIVSCNLGPTSTISKLNTYPWFQGFPRRKHLDTTAAIIAILKGNSFPVIRTKSHAPAQRFKRALSAEWPFELVEYQPEMRYVAISHVWSHGLGNPESNSLPSSDMARLLEYAMDLEHGAFWIDTICVPTKGPYKLKGITKLREVYEKASIVLVVDGRLTQIIVTSMIEAKMQFLCCEWFSRLWTLQEGWMASDLYVQFYNAALSVDQLLRTFGIASIYPGRMGLDDELYKQLRPYFDKTSNAVNLMSLQRAMHGRRVTEKTDEPICIATLLNLDFAMFEPGQPTMEKIFRQLKLPEGLLWSEGPRLTTHGFRWAPASLLNQLGNSRLLDYQEDPAVLHTCELTPDGLRTTQAYFELYQGLDLVSNDDDITPAGSSTDQALRVSICNAQGNEIMVLRITRKIYEQHGRPARSFKRPCILIGSLRKADGGDVMLGQAILVENVQDVAGVLYGNYVMILREVKAELVKRYVDDRIVRVRGDFMSRAEWCID